MTVKRVTKERREAVAAAAWLRVLEMDQLGQTRFGYGEVAVAMNIFIGQATSIVRGWEKAGLVKVVQQGPGLRRMFTVTPEADRPKKPQGRSAEQNMWTAMRGLKAFSPTDLSAHATTDVVSVQIEDARAYCQSLLAVGYLRVERKAMPGRSEAIYRLVRNTGPLPPIKRRVTAIIDPNRGETLVIGGDA